MLPRIVIVALIAGLVGTAALFAWQGVWGESNRVVSTRVGSPGGGYGFTGGVK